MGDLAAADFDRYFRTVHGHDPYPWQSRLTRQVLADGNWPSVIDLPTGTGKTSVLDTAIFSLAARPDVFPRRVVFVIDRRIVVDQVYERAEKIARAISRADQGVLADLRERLDGLSSVSAVLGVSALRGGIPLDGEWFRRPEQPWVMVSTVDQFGSRLLFRGYGVSDRMRPVHAGLAGNDCLVFLDEVHLSRAFAETLREASADEAVPGIRSVGGGLPRRFQIVEMSATPTGEGESRFKLLPEDCESSVTLNEIANAPKRATLVEVPGSRPAHETIPRSVLELLRKKLRDHELSVGVIVNRVRTAREVHAALIKAGITAHLVTGRMRPIDKQEVLEDISECVDPDRFSPLEQRTVVVATQAIEVGADFSFDALITEAAPIDSLQQRLGRLDRRGKLAESSGPARCWILGVASALNPKKPDPIYGDSVRVAWEGLQTLAQDGQVEVGPAERLLDRLDSGAQAPRSEAPLLLPTHIAAWTQTNPRPVIDPPIREFLHGKEREDEPDVSVVWRLDRSEQAIVLVPPRPAEFLSVPVSAVRRWLSGTGEVPVGDTATVSPEEEETKRGRSAERPLSGVVRWERKSNATVPIDDVKAIQPGDVIIVDPEFGGLRNGTWDPSYRPEARGSSDDRDTEPRELLDIGDQAQYEHGKRATLRLDPRLFESLGVPHLPDPAQEIDAEEPPQEIIRDWLSKTRDLPAGAIPEWLLGVVKLLAKNYEHHIVNGTDDADYYLLVQKSVDPAVLDSFEDQPSLTGTRTTLRNHLVGVGAKAAAYGRSLQLPSEAIDDLRLAAELHDLGKVDSRFQDQMHGHDPVLLAEPDEPLAKSIPGARTQRHEWPPVRHEFSSVALAQSFPELLERANDRDLVLHLVGSHHGHSRPIPMIKEDDKPQTLKVSGEFLEDGFRLVADDQLRTAQENCGLVSMEIHSDLAETRLALEMADRFWRLQGRYGHHGLAWLEAILRLADWQQSAEEQP